MSPSAYRHGGQDSVIRFAVGECPFGSILVAATARGVCAIQLGDEPQALVDELQRRFPHAELLGADPGFEKLIAQVVGSIENPRAGLDLPLDIAGRSQKTRRLSCGPCPASSSTKSARDTTAR